MRKTEVWLCRFCLICLFTGWLSGCGGGSGSAPATPGLGVGSSTPTITITSPANLSSGLAGTIVVSASATDDVGVTSVEFQVDGAAAGPALTAPPYSVTLDTSLYVAGQHVIRARAADAAGNRSPWSTVTVQMGSRTQPNGYTRNETFITGLTAATAFAQSGDGRLFVAQQGGALRVVKAGVLLPTPFVTLAVDSAGERGLLGVALHPNFASNGFVYVYYTTTAGGTHNRISRFIANGDVAVAGSESVLADLPLLSATNHNGGAIHFGIDGKLYVGVGDNNVGSNSQDPSSPLGKLLRFNDDGTIPVDNPFFATQSGLARAVWASGLRNPFTFAVQPGSGRIHINDVGQGTWEEINLGAAGANYGWPGSEGPDNITAGVTAPLFTYKHSNAVPAGSGAGGFFVGQAIAGGAFYPGSGMFPVPYRGGYFFGDFVSRFIGFIDLQNDNAAYAFAQVSGNPVKVVACSTGRAGWHGALSC